MNASGPLKAGWELTGEGPMSDAQRRLLNAACRDLAAQIRPRPGVELHPWMTFEQDDWRHFLAGMALGFRPVPMYDRGDGYRGIVMLGRSSLDLSKSQATDAITMAFHIGDDPESQHVDLPPITWSEVVYLARGIPERER